jgi:DNA-binding transcriptional LysR family regulator
VVVGLDARRVLLFRDVVRAGSLTAAARDLGWTQPAVSQHLQRLERDAGCPLLVRGPRGVVPTEAGRALLARADAVAGELRLAEEEVAALAGLRAGRVRLAAFPSAAAVLAPAAIALLTARFPGLEVSMTEAEPPGAMAAVRVDEADLALVFGHDGPPADHRELAWTPVLREPVHLVLPRDHRGTRLEELADEPWIAGCPRCRSHLVDRCAVAGFVPRVRYESDDYVMVQALVAQGLGVTSLPASALAAYRHPEVVVRDEPALGSRHVGLVHRAGAEQVPAIGALREVLVGSGRRPSTERALRPRG